MNTLVRLQHHTSYSYDRPVFLGPQTIRLHPLQKARPPILSYALNVAPTDGNVTWLHDENGNNIAEAIFAKQVSHFDITIHMTVDITPYNPFHNQEKCATKLPENPAYHHEISDTALLDHFLDGQFYTSGKTPLDRLIWLNRKLTQHLHYETRLEPGVWSPAETLSRQSGSCRDSAWLMIAFARRLGFAARFVSGYLIQTNMQDKNNQTLTCDLHAWAEIWVPESGWFGFDTTSGLITAQNHIPLAVSATPEDAAPVSGLLDHCHAEFSVLMEAQYLHSEGNS